MGMLDFLSVDQSPYYRKAEAQIDTAVAPTLDELRVYLQDLVQTGQISPQQAEAVLVERSAYEDVPESSIGRDAELAALSQLRGITEAGGLTDIDKARIGQINEEVAQAQRGARGAIGENMAARGMAGSGFELAQQLSAQQAGAGEANKRGLETAALAEQRALEALRSQGALGGQVAGRDLQRAQAIAEAKDRIAQFNAANKQNVGLTNTAALNTAQAANLAEKQRIADANVGQKNWMAQNEAAIRQQTYQNALDKAKAKAGLATGQGESEAQRRQRELEFIGGLIGTGGTIVAGQGKKG